MLDSQQELDRPQSNRSQASRFDASFHSGTEAAIVLREMCGGQLLLSLAVGVSALRVGSVGVIAGLVMAIPTVVLLVSRHRAAAVALVVCTVLLFADNSVRERLPVFVWIASLPMAGRASWVAFMLHQSSSVGGGENERPGRSFTE
jgi:hypothetical protein